MSALFKYVCTMFFVFSTFYGLAYFYYQAQGSSLEAQGLEDRDTTDTLENPENSSWVSDIISGTLDYVLDALSWFSPFGLIKAIIYMLAPEKLYEVLNIFLLRPLGWVGTFITTEWIINKFRGTSE